MRRKKKGALQLSINAIVILILAITMLGLGLAFIKGLFGGTVEKLKGMTEQIEESERNELLSSPDKVTLPRVIKIEGRTKELYFAIRNINQYDTNYYILMAADETGADLGERVNTIECFDAIGVENKELIREWITFETYETRMIENGGSDILPLIIKISPSAKPTTYSCEISLVIKEAPDAPIPQEVESTVYTRKRFDLDYKKN